MSRVSATGMCVFVHASAPTHPILRTGLEQVLLTRENWYGRGQAHPSSLSLSALECARRDYSGFSKVDGASQSWLKNAAFGTQDGFDRITMIDRRRRCRPDLFGHARNLETLGSVPRRHPTDFGGLSAHPVSAELSKAVYLPRACSERARHVGDRHCFVSKQTMP